MTYIYYTARTGRRNANGHTTTRGTVYKASVDANGDAGLANLGEYSHMSGGAGIEKTILDVCQRAGIDIGAGYYGNWHNSVSIEEI